MKKISTENKIAAGIAVSLLVLVSIGLLTYHTTTNLVATQNWVAHTYDVMGTLESGLAILTDAETEQRAYLLTGDDKFLKDARNAEGKVGGWLENMRRLTADNPEEQRRLDQLQPLIQQRLALLNSRIELRQRQGMQAAAEAVALGQGRDLMEQVWAKIGEMHDVESRLLKQRQQAAQDSARTNTVIAAASSVLACGVVLLAFFIIQKDLRLRERTERDIKKSEGMLESILDNMPAVIFMKDLQGRYLFINRRFAEVTGFPQSEVKGKTVFDIAKKEQAEAADGHFRTVMAAGKAVEFEETVMYPDGPHPHRAVKFPLRNEAGEIYAVAGISTDITERRRFEELLRESEERLRLLVESVKDYAIIMLDAAGQVVSWNAGAAQIKGYAVEEIIGEDFSRFYPPEVAASGFPEQQLARAAAEGRAEDEGWRIRKDGSRFWARVVITAIRNAGGQLLGFAKVTCDRTEQKLADQMLKQLNQTLGLQATELEATNRELEAFSYSVSHDLRSPLRHIDGFVDLLKKQALEKLDDRSRRYLGIIADSAKEMGCLIDDLLVFSRMSRAEMRHVRVATDSLLNEAVKAAGNDAQDREIVWNIGPLPEVEADPAMLRQVWMNLIGNAVKYTRTRHPAEIAVGCNDDGNGELVFFVRDNGVGFDMQYVHKLFGVFQRLHRSDEFEGTGIGLANVRRIVSRHGGRTWAEGKINEGATFFFSMPKTKHSNKG